ncbi:MAG: UDP-N-acetylmuramate dehydrogenase [Bdellovibrionota bacterium]
MTRVPRPGPDVFEALGFDVPLGPFAAYTVGGSADILFSPQGEDELIEGLDWAYSNVLPTFVLGSGTNLLIRDGGVRGLVVYLGPQTRSWHLRVIERDADSLLVRVPGAFSKAELLEWSLENGCEGLEFSAGIPGTMGGAVFMNAGTRWGSYANVIESVRIWVPGEGPVEKNVADMGFRYRGHGDGALAHWSVVLTADLRLKISKDPEASRSLVDRILSYRGSRQALERPSCGSVFKNPENSTRGAGRLIESAALKGTRRGGAQLSTKHANFLLNRGNATAADIEELILFTQRRVKEEFGIQLEPEVIVVGRAQRLEEEVYALREGA